MADTLWLQGLAVLLRQIEGSEQHVPNGKFDRVVAGMAVTFWDLGRVMPAMHLGRHEDVIQDPAIQIRAAMLQRSTDKGERNRNQNRNGIEPNDADNEEDQDVAQRIVD